MRYNSEYTESILTSTGLVADSCFFGLAAEPRFSGAFGLFFHMGERGTLIML
jgi:hypothetical protein